MEDKNGSIPFAFVCAKCNEPAENAIKCADSSRSVCITRNTIESGDLLCKNNKLIIKHNGDEYTLRITSNNKLILNK